MATASNGSTGECSICTETFRVPKLLPCFHTFCLECLQQFVSASSKEGQFPCPLCRYKVTLPVEGVAGFQTNFYIEARAEKQVHSGGEHCGVCEQRATHSSHQCEILLCEQCSAYHQKLPATRSHMLVNLGESGEGKPLLSVPKFCEKQQEEKLRFYCTPCDKLVCRDCKLTDHEGHKSCNISDIAEAARTSLTKTKQELENYKAEINALLDDLKHVSNDVSDNISHAKNEINQIADSLVYDINKVRRQVIDRLIDKENIEIKKLSDKRFTFTEMQTFLRSQIDHTNLMLSAGVECDVISTDSRMKERLAELDKEYPDVSESQSKSLKRSPVLVVLEKSGFLDVMRSAVRALTFNPFAETGQKFKPVDVCWGNNQEIYIVDRGPDMIVEYSLRDGFQSAFKVPNKSHLSAIVVDTDGQLWIGDSHGYIHICVIDRFLTKNV